MSYRLRGIEHRNYDQSRLFNFVEFIVRRAKSWVLYLTSYPFPSRFDTATLNELRLV